MGEQELMFSGDALDGPSGPEEVEKIRSRALECIACPLAGGRTQVVFGEGSANSPPVAFVGEGPGKNEDLNGHPFVGRAGQLLDSMLDSMGLRRDQVFITNAVLCRPPENRTPTPPEIEACKVLLYTQLRAVKPQIIVALGKTAANALLGVKKKLALMRGSWHDWEGTPVRVSYHPAYLLRDPANKKAAWDDLQAVMLRLGIVKKDA
jgi:uracil-DNA glycosylase